MSELLKETHPEVWEESLRYPVGLNVIKLQGEARPLLLLKLPQPLLLTARTNRGFKIYVVPLDTPQGSTIGLMSAFFDDEDEPLTIWSPLSVDISTFILLKALGSLTLKVRLFDDNNRELLGYNARIDVPLISKIRLEQANLLHLTHDLAHYMHEQATLWFGVRGVKDDNDAISIVFESPLYEENLTYIDDRTDLFKFKGSNGFAEVRLEKSTPEDTQEIDIILLLQRLFSPEQIYHSPKKPKDNKEIADILILTDLMCLLVQAKDSPNTERQLANDLGKKQDVAVKHLGKACRQLARSVAYMRTHRPLVMKMKYGQEIVEIGNRPVLCLAVVRELFHTEYQRYSPLLYELHRKTDLPCIGIDYSELIQYMTFCASEEAFIHSYFQVFNKALEGNGFPRLRFGVNDLFNEDGSFRFE
jgi:hypothetical protein